MPPLTDPSPMPRLMAAINVSPESFHPGSVAADQDALFRMAGEAEAGGASMLDIGAMSTAPYKETRISELEERERMRRAIRALRPRTSLLISADTQRASVAEAALGEGADVLNDVSALAADPRIAQVAAGAGCRVILMANGGDHGTPEGGRTPLEVVRGLLEEAIRRALEGGIKPDKLLLDPGVGFFRRQSIPWNEWDMALLRGLGGLRDMGHPLVLAASRKSFIGKALGRTRPEDRLAGSLAVALWCARAGADWLRVHDVAATHDVLRMWELLGEAT